MNLFRDPGWVKFRNRDKHTESETLILYLVVKTVQALIVACVARSPHHRQIFKPAIFVPSDCQLDLPQGLKKDGLFLAVLLRNIFQG